VPLVVAVVGDALLDVTIDPSEPMRPGGDVPAAVRVGPGGQGANVAVRLARRRVAVRLACALGEDGAGRLVRDALEADGVRVDAAGTSATGAVALVIAAGGERAMLSQRVPVLPGVDLGALSHGIDWLVVSGYALLEDGAIDFARRCAAHQTRRAILGCALPGDGVPAWRSAAGAAAADLLVLNVDEARALSGRDDLGEALAATLAPELGELVVVTGPRGASAAGTDLRVTVDAAADGAGALDTTGAGDAFAADLIAAVGATWPPDADALRAAMSRALATAAEVVGVPGAQGVVPSEAGATR
jgi:ribokinase